MSAIDWGSWPPPWADKLGMEAPSLDDKDTPSPPILTTEEYEACKAAGVVRGGKPVYGNKQGKLEA